MALQADVSKAAETERRAAIWGQARLCSHSSSEALLDFSRLPAMAFRALFVFLSFAAAFAEDAATALASDDVCDAGQDCSLELNQLRGIKVHYLEALEEDEEECRQVEEEAELEGGGCTGAADMRRQAKL